MDWAVSFANRYVDTCVDPWPARCSPLAYIILSWSFPPSVNERINLSAQIKARNDEIRKIQSDLTNVERNQQDMLKRIRMETESAEISETKNSEGRR